MVDATHTNDIIKWWCDQNMIGIHGKWWEYDNDPQWCFSPVHEVHVKMMKND
jgi:hypothetical protein